MPAFVTEEERKLYDELSRVKHPDPRAELLAAAQRS
jgi:curved DNA-binding protein